MKYLAVLIFLFITTACADEMEYGNEYTCNLVIALLEASTNESLDVIVPGIDHPIELRGIHEDVPYHWLFVINPDTLALTFEGEGSDPSLEVLAEWDSYVQYMGPPLSALSDIVDNITLHQAIRDTGQSCTTPTTMANTEITQ